MQNEQQCLAGQPLNQGRQLDLYIIRGLAAHFAAVLALTEALLGNPRQQAYNEGK